MKRFQATASRCQGSVVAIAATFALSAPAHAACPGSTSGGFFESLTRIFRASTGQFEVKRNGVTYTGSMEVKDVSCGVTTVTLRGTAAIGSSVRLRRGLIGVEASARVGTAAELEVTMPSGGFSSTTPLDVFDPSTLPAGSTVIMREEYFASAELEASYRALVVAAGYEVGSGVVVAVQKGEDGRVRLMVGPYEVVRNESFIGVGAGDFKVGVGRSDELETGRLQQWTFDPSKPGEVRDYQLALLQGTALGTVPYANGRPHDTVEYATYESLSGGRLEAGPIKLGVNFGSSSGDWRVVTHPDGTKSATSVFNYNGTILNLSQEFDRNGNPVGDQKVSVAFTEMSDWDAYMLDTATGQPTSEDWDGAGLGGRKLEFTPQNWQEWRDRASERIRRDPSMVPAFLQGIADAKGPLDVAMALYLSDSSAYVRTFQDLFDLSQEGDRGALPGGSGRACPNATEDDDDARDDAQALANLLASNWCGANVDLNATTTPFLNAGTNQSAGPAVGAGMLRE